MPDLILKSERQVQTDILNKIIALLGLNDVNKGSVLDILTRVIAQEDFAQYIQMAQIVRLTDLDALTGDDLDNKAFEYGLQRSEAVSATGLISILRAASFTKVSTTFYAGLAAAVVGDTTINVNDASDALYSTSGTLILGRGTTNEEEVAYSLAPVNNTNYWTFTLDSALTNNHAIEETVILKQGSDETILAGTTVIVPASSTSIELQFTVDNDTTLYAGEESVTNVAVTASDVGTDYNISTEAISGSGAFPTAPFTGARASNLSKFTTGADRQNDDQLRDAIKDHIQSLGRGTKQAVLNAIVGLVDADSAKRIISASVILPQDTDTPVKVYIDDGIGFEPTFVSEGFETIISEATGGESRLQLDLFPVVKAQIETSNSENYDMSTVSLTLSYEVGIDSEIITFAASDFAFPDSATAEEIVAAINNRAVLIEARTSQNGTKIVITAKSNTNENIQVTGGTGNSILGFPTDRKDSMYLYVDDVLKSKDGQTAFIDSGNSAPYNLLAIGAYPHTLTLVVDGKTANSQTITFQSADFTDPAACTVAEIIAVINAQLAGGTAEGADSNTIVRIISNTLLSSDSKIEITGGAANNAVNGLNFSTVEVEGVDGDYTLNRELGTIELTNPLTALQSVTAGSRFTRALLRASLDETYAPNNGETLVISVDGGGNQTITFDATFVGGKSATDTATFINAQLRGAVASTRTIGTSTYIEITTNTYEESTGSIEIKSASTANAVFLFTLDTEVTNQRPHKAYRESSNTGPYTFSKEDSLVVVVDDDIVNNTFSVIMSYDGIVSTNNSTTNFKAAGYINIFQVDDVLEDFYLAFLTGANTLNVSGTVTTITNPGGTTFRYAFSALPAGLAAFAIGDIVEFTDFANTENNGNFIITGISVAGNGYIEVTNASGIAETGAAASCDIGERRQVSSYTALDGDLTTTAFTNAPAIADTFIILPSTLKNMEDYIANTRITSLSLKATTESTTNDTKLQIASLSEGSDGYIQITGGSANTILGFSTDIHQGLQAYDHYTGLLKLAHKTIYGDDKDLISFPGIGAAGVQFQLLSPTVYDFSVNLDITLKEGISISQIENEVLSAVTGYINNLGVGDDVIIENIRAVVIAIDGITDVVLNTPSANIAIADNEIARINSNNITIG